MFNLGLEIKIFKYLNVYYFFMALEVKKISDVYEMKVFTDSGSYFGDVEECIVTKNKVFGWRVRATKSSTLNNLLGGAKGVIVPHQLVKAIGSIMIISRNAMPNVEEAPAQQQFTQ